jgi:hypothetical protein
MPEVNFKSIERLFATKAKDRLETETTASGTRVFAAGSLAEDASGLSPTTARQQIVDGVRMRGPYGGHLNGDERVGFVLTSEMWRLQGRAIQLHAGPSQVSWTLPLRASEEPTKSGHARFAQARIAHGSTSETTYFDSPRVSIEFQTGNIMPIPLLLDEVQTPYGLQDFYLFMELLNQPPLVPDGPYEGKHNYVWIFYTSLQFPQVVLKGYFDPGGVTWQEEAGGLAERTWSAEFMVHEMSPEIWQQQELVEAYQMFMKNNVRLL